MNIHATQYFLAMFDTLASISFFKGLEFMFNLRQSAFLSKGRFKIAE